jgi:hypothetical protein
MPAINKIHVDKILTEVSVQYKNNDYIADSIFPKINVKKLSDKYFVFDREFTIPETTRAIGGVAREFDFGLSTNGYVLQKHSLKDIVSDDEIDNYDIATLEADTTEILTDKIKLRKEKIASDMVNATGTWSLQVSLAVAWTTNSTTSSPFPIINTALAAIPGYGSPKPNFMIMPYKAYLGLKDHVSVLDKIKYTSSDFTVEMLQGLFDIEKIVIPMAVYNTAAPGVTESMSYIWDTFAFIGYKAPRPAPKSVSWAYMFEKKNAVVRKWRDEEREGNVIEVTSHFDPKVICSLCGFLIKGVN